MKSYGRKYNSYDMGCLRGTFVVWVLRGPRGTEYVIGYDAVPDSKRMGDIIARIGPIAYEEGQGLERIREQIAEDVKTAEEECAKEHERQQIMDMVRREVQAWTARPETQVTGSPLPTAETTDQTDKEA